MLNKHFFKTVSIFTGLLVLGIAGALLVGYLDESAVQTASSPDGADCPTTAVC